MAIKNYKQRLDNLRARRQDVLTKAYSLSEGFSQNKYGETVTYVLESMEPIENSYTQNTYEACEKVQTHLLSGLKEKGIDVQFRYQGSVPTNTHIKNYSDIDLLVIRQGFATVEPPQQVVTPYQGNPVEDLKDMRKYMFKILDSVYSAAEIDDTGSKALNISGGSLNRSIDIISCNWYNSVKYSETLDEDYRGINILHREKNERILNYPFMHIYWINHKDQKVNGMAKKLIRFLKTIKADADKEIKVSSYDIASLVFRMEDSQLLLSESKSLLLLENCNSFFQKIIDDKSFRDTLYVANGTRKIFADDGVSVEELKKLKQELTDVINDIIADVKPLYGKLEKAETFYKIMA